MRRRIEPNRGSAATRRASSRCRLLSSVAAPRRRRRSATSPARGVGGNADHPESEAPEHADALALDDQCHREPDERHLPYDPARLPLEERLDDPSLGRRGRPPRSETLPPPRGPPPHAPALRSPRLLSSRSSCRPNRCQVVSQPAASQRRSSTFNGTLPRRAVDRLLPPDRAEDRSLRIDSRVWPAADAGRGQPNRFFRA